MSNSVQKCYRGHTNSLSNKTLTTYSPPLLTRSTTLYQTPAMYQNSHHYLSDTHYLSISSITIYQTHAPFQMLHSHHCLHAFSARPQIALFARYSMTIHTLHTPLESGSDCVGHPTTSMWMATGTHLGPRTLYQWHTHHNMQTLSAVSCQRSAVSCR